MIVRVAPPKLRMPPLAATPITGTTATFDGVEVMLPVSVKVPPGLTVGTAVPPLLLKTRPARELLPNKVSVEPPLRVAMLPEPIWP